MYEYDDDSGYFRTSYLVHFTYLYEIVQTYHTYGDDIKKSRSREIRANNKYSEQISKNITKNNMLTPPVIKTKPSYEYDVLLIRYPMVYIVKKK